MNVSELFNNPDQPFTPEELRELGLVKDDATNDATRDVAPAAPEPEQAAAPPPAESTPPAPDTSSAAVTPDRLAEVIERLTQYVDARTAPAGDDDAQPDVPSPSVEQLVEEGDVAGALKAVKNEAERKVEQLSATQAALLSSYAKELFRQKLGDEEFSRWWPLMERQMAAHGVSPTQFVTVDQLEQALKVTKAENLELVLQEERRKWEQENRAHLVGGGSVGERTLVPPDVDIDPVAYATARDLGLDARTWARNKKIIDKTNTSDDPRVINDVPLIDEDFTNRDAFGDIVIEPGRF